MRHESWLSHNFLRSACQLRSQDGVKDEVVWYIVEHLDNFHITPDVRVTKGFRSEVCIAYLNPVHLVTDSVLVHPWHATASK